MKTAHKTLSQTKNSAVEICQLSHVIGDVAQERNQSSNNQKHEPKMRRFENKLHWSD